MHDRPSAASEKAASDRVKARVLVVGAGPVGLTLANQVKPGELFGVRWRGLSAAPATLVEQNYAVIHALKERGQFARDR